jgi:hypothetical protein
LCSGLSLLIGVCSHSQSSNRKTFDVDADRKRAFELQLEDGKEEIQRLKLVKEIPENLEHGLKDRLEANAFNVLGSLLNLVGKNVSYFATFERFGPAVSKTGTPNRVVGTDKAVRLSKSLLTDIQNVYGDAKEDFLRGLVRFDKSLQDAGLLLLKRVDENVVTILTGREGLYLSQRRLADCFS